MNTATTYDKTNTGILGKNDRKTEDTHPTHTGSINVNGTEFWLNAWVKERTDGSGRFFSLTVKPKAPPPSRQAPRQVERTGTGFDSLDSEIPF